MLVTCGECNESEITIGKGSGTGGWSAYRRGFGVEL